MRTLRAPRRRVEGGADWLTEPAADHTVLAAERTYAAWGRTGLEALAAGVGVKAILAHILTAWFGMATGHLGSRCLAARPGLRRPTSKF